MNNENFLQASSSHFNHDACNAYLLGLQNICTQLNYLVELYNHLHIAPLANAQDFYRLFSDYQKLYNEKSVGWDIVLNDVEVKPAEVYNDIMQQLFKYLKQVKAKGIQEAKGPQQSAQWQPEDNRLAVLVSATEIPNYFDFVEGKVMVKQELQERVKVLFTINNQ